MVWGRGAVVVSDAAAAEWNSASDTASALKTH